MSYPGPPVTTVPANAKIWGYAMPLVDPRWRDGGRVDGLNTVGMGGKSPNYDDMKITAINYWCKDEDKLINDSGQMLQQPAFLFKVFCGVERTTPVGAHRILKTIQYYIKRINNVPHSGEGWQRIPIDPPVKWEKDMWTWVFVDPYNGQQKVTWYHKWIHNNPDRLNFTGVPKHIKDREINKIITASSRLSGHFAINLEYVVGDVVAGVPLPVPEPPKPIEERMDYAEMELKKLKVRVEILESK